MTTARTLLVALLIFVFAWGPQVALGSMTSPNYKIQWDSVGFGGSANSTSASYTVRDALTTGAADRMTSTNYAVSSGFGVSVYDPAVAFSVVAENRSTQVAATSITSATVDVSTASGYAVGDYIVAVQDEGASQVSAMGKITGIAGTTITVDSFSFADSLPSIDGTNDYVYKLSGTSMTMASVTTSTVVTSVIGWEVTADVSQGYSVYVLEDSGLTSSLDEMDIIRDVDDGTVSAGRDEYGARSSDATLSASTFDTMDTGINTALQQVASRSSYSHSTRDFLTLKLATDGTHDGGTYSHTITLVFVGDY